MNFKQLRQRQFRPVGQITDFVGSTDIELILACQHGEPLAFEAMRRRFLGLVCRILSCLVPERKDNDDLLQDIFVRVWQSIGQLRDPRVFKAWLRKIVCNCSHDELRSRPDKLLVYLDCALSTEDDVDGFFIQISDKTQKPEESAEYNELTSKIESELLKLKPMARTLIVLRAEGLSYDQIASLTRTELGTVKSRLARARIKLKSHITRGDLMHCA